MSDNIGIWIGFFCLAGLYGIYKIIKEERKIAKGLGIFILVVLAVCGIVALFTNFQPDFSYHSYYFQKGMLRQGFFKIDGSTILKGVCVVTGFVLLYAMLRSLFKGYHSAFHLAMLGWMFSACGLLADYLQFGERAVNICEIAGFLSVLLGIGGLLFNKKWAQFLSATIISVAVLIVVNGIL